MDLNNKSAIDKAKSYKRELYASRLTPDLSDERRVMLKDYIDTGMELTLNLYLEEIVPLLERIRSIEGFLRIGMKVVGAAMLFIFAALGTAFFQLILKG